jgi:hypothetical protein
MSSSNPSAFPQALTVEKEFLGSEGMSLRDYFAAAALTGVLQARALLNGPDSLGFQEDVAEECYELADAMLQAREAKP